MKTEVDGGVPQNPESASQREKKEIKKAWGEALMAIQGLAEVMDTEITRMSPTFKLSFNEYGVFHFRVNAAIANSDGKLKTMVVDIGYEKEENSGNIIPTQQAVVEGVWEAGKVIDATSDLSNVNKTRWKLDEGLISRYVTGMIKAITAKEEKKRNNLEQAPIEETTPVAIFVPEAYSTGIN